MKRTLLLGIAGLAVLAAGVVVIALIIQRDENEHLRHVSRLAETGELTRAQSELRALDPATLASFEDLVEAAFLAARLDPEQLPAFLRGALERDDRTARGMARLTRIATTAGEVDMARTLLEEALRLGPRNPDVFLAAARYNHATGNHREAVLFYDNAFARIEAMPMDELNFAESLALSEEVSKIVRAKNILLRLTQEEEGPASIGAFIVLGNFNQIPLVDAEIPEFLERFRNHPDLEETLRGRASLTRRLIGRFERYDPRFAFRVGQVLMRDEDATNRDRLSFAFIALKQGEHEAARRALEPFEGLDRETAEFQALEAYLTMQRGRSAAGVEQLASANDAHPSNPAVLSVAEAILFLETPDLVLSEKEEIASILLNHSLVSPNLVLQCFDLLMEIRPLRANDLMAQAVSRLRNSHPELLAAWLQRRGEHEVILRLTAEIPEGGNEQILQGIRLDSLLALNRIDELAAELDDHEETISQILRHLLRAEVFFRKGETQAAWRRWEVGFEQASLAGQLMGLRRLAALAGREGDADRALRAYLRVFTDEPGSLSEEELTYLLSLSLPHDDLSTSVRIARAAAEMYPDSPRNLNNAAYLNILANERVPESVETMRRIAREYPERQHYQLTYALALLRAGQPREALRIAEEIRIDMTAAGAQEQVIYAAILAANNRETLAASIAANIDRDRLFPAERALVDNLRR